MRKILAMGLAILLCGWANLGQAQDLKIGIVNLKDILDRYGKVKDGEEQLMKEADEKGSQEEKLIQQVKSLRDKIDLLKDEKKQQAQQELDKKVQELQDFKRESRSGLLQKRDDKFIEIMKDVKDVIEEYGKSRKYNLVIDDTFLLYHDGSMDVTEDIVKILNQRYKK